MDLEFFINPNHTHFDLTTAICTQVKATPIEWRVWHTKGHQDPFKKLNWWDKLNIEIDHLAHRYLQELQESPRRQYQQRIYGGRMDILVEPAKGSFKPQRESVQTQPQTMNLKKMGEEGIFQRYARPSSLECK